MKSRLRLASVLALAFGLLVRPAPAQDKPDLTDPNQQYNYAFGMDVISTFKQCKVAVDINAFAAGMADSLAGKPLLTAAEKQAAITTLAKQMAAQAAIDLKALAARNLKAGAAFLAENAKKDGIHVTEVTAPDGTKTQLQYRILQSGPPGPSPQKADTVEVDYVGSSIEGRVFDSSIKRGFPATFGVADVMPGWAAALQMMRAGDKWQLFVPPALGFGENGLPQTGPNATLVFELDLRSFFTPKKVVGSITNAPALNLKQS